MNEVKAESDGRETQGTVKRTRRQWTAKRKQQIVRETQRRGAVIQEVAGRHGVNVSVLNRWRTEQRVRPLGARKAPNAVRLLPVRVHGAQPPRTSSGPVQATIAVTTKLDTIEVELSSGGRVYVRGVVNPEMLRAVLREMSQP